MIMAANNFRTALQNFAIVTVFVGVNMALGKHHRRKIVTTTMQQGIYRFLQIFKTRTMAYSEPECIKSATHLIPLPVASTTACSKSLQVYPSASLKKSSDVPVFKYRKFKRFTSLPVELRELIYEYAMCRGGHFTVPAHAASRTARTRRVFNNHLPAVCFTSRTERLVATSVFIRKSSFRFSCAVDAIVMTSWLERMNDGHYFNSVRCMEINYMPSDRMSGFAIDFDFLQRCPGLRELTISIPLEELNLITYNNARLAISKRPMTQIELLTKFQLARILECANLCKVTFTISSKYTFGFASSLSSFYHNLGVLMSLMKMWFMGRHRRVPQVISLAL
ncbi:hypothetical protein BDU57DRAFT_573385 [Ampelomyces quisqualis]|uniref:2EXR domain-containing protein n=1 Tax=Ampelomyces quisqualis TaxID=50730 RepID=A0A6A5QJN7_AMPQU|nr:hypothetical protein BDU57DRAFT_573385 [Ampelomyces quisqualis]